MKIHYLTMAVLFSLFQVNASAQAILPSNKIDAFVLKQFHDNWHYKNTILVFLKQQTDLSGADTLPTKEEKTKFVYEQLRQTALHSQTDLVSYLKTKKVKFRQYYIQNMILIEKPSAELVNTLALRDDVAKIKGNPVTTFKPILIPDLYSSLLSKKKNGVPPGISRIGATRVWEKFQNFGAGIIVASQDTGVQWDHPALIHQYRGWSEQKIDHNYNWHDAIHFPLRKSNARNRCGYNLQTPCDDLDHGTHTVGTMVGDDQKQEKIGVAPKAQWIACKNMDNNLGSVASYLECFEFFLAPYPLNGNPLHDGDTERAPHIINNSWGCFKSEGCEGNEMEAALVAMKKAGIFVVASAGNEGPRCSTIASPPGMHTQTSFSVGALNVAYDTIAYFSSRGPSTFDGGLAPHITAPGVSVRSAIPNNDYGYMDGTSMAGPHVAGAVALLWSANKKLIGQIDKSIELLEKTAEPHTDKVNCGGVPGTQIPNNTYGYGLINIYESIKSLR